MDRLYRITSIGEKQPKWGKWVKMYNSKTGRFTLSYNSSRVYKSYGSSCPEIQVKVIIPSTDGLYEYEYCLVGGTDKHGWIGGVSVNFRPLLINSITTKQYIDLMLTSPPIFRLPEQWRWADYDNYIPYPKTSADVINAFVKLLDLLQTEASLRRMGVGSDFRNTFQKPSPDVIAA